MRSETEVLAIMALLKCRMEHERLNFLTLMEEFEEEEDRRTVQRNSLITLLLNETSSEPEGFNKTSSEPEALNEIYSGPEAFNETYRGPEALNETSSESEADSEEMIARYTNADFHRLFRMTRQTFHSLLDALKLLPEYQKNRIFDHYPLSAEKKTLIGLVYLASMDTASEIGNKFNVCDRTVWQAVEDLCNALFDLRSNCMRLPNAQESVAIAEQFHKICGFPRIVGAIGRCPFERNFSKDAEDDHNYSKSKETIVLHGVCTASKIFTNVFIRPPDPMHNAQVSTFSSIHQKVEDRGPSLVLHNQDFHLIGDSGDTLKRWIMTPYRDTGHLTEAQLQFNTKLSKSRAVVEKTFGLLKGRWRRLQNINENCTEQICKIILACCVLHNFCYLQDDFSEDYISDDFQYDIAHNYEDEEGTDGDAVAQAKREYLKELIFTPS